MPAYDARWTARHGTFGMRLLYGMNRQHLCTFHTFVHFVFECVLASGQWSSAHARPARVGSASVVTFHRRCMVMWDTWEHTERARSGVLVHTDQDDLSANQLVAGSW